MQGDMAKLFGVSSRSLISFLQNETIGFYIPLYQRDYSWDRDNVEQLMEDLCQGVCDLLSEPDEIMFLGTIIRVQAVNPLATLYPRDEKAIPKRVDKIIDGQQRLSTIALLGCLLYNKYYLLGKKIEKFPSLAFLNKEIIQINMKPLTNLFAFDLERGKPTKKPKVIRGAVDSWTLNGAENDNYKSPIAYYISQFLKADDNTEKIKQYPTTSGKGGLLDTNLRIMGQYLSKIEEAHLRDDDLFPRARRILETMSQTLLWEYDRPELRDIIFQKNNSETEISLLSSLVQLLAFNYFLFNRCCFTIIDPISDDWAFDMFQSLNATGTPLTALETFKPMVVNAAEEKGGNYKGSEYEQYFGDIDSLFVKEKSAAQKTKATDEYMTALAHIHDGTKLARRFTTQRKWLVEKFDGKPTEEKREFIRTMANLASYLREVKDFDEQSLMAIGKLDNSVTSEEKELATLCLLYLDDANHQMAHTLLSRFYAYVLRGEDNSTSEFVAAAKAIAAFFTLWRATNSNSGLDEVYRQILRGKTEKDKTSGVETIIEEPMVWRSDKSCFTVKRLKKLLLDALAQKDVATKENWVNKAVSNYRFDLSGQHVCRFTLLLLANFTMPDADQFGLIKNARISSSANYLSPKSWRRPDYHTVEHIAPQKPSVDSNWDPHIYEADTDNFHLIGNLALLPKSVNSSASNKDWKTKWIFYSYIGEQDPTKLKLLDDLAVKDALNISGETQELLTNTAHNKHILPLVGVGIDGNWNNDLITRRTANICDLVWDHLYSWLT